MTFTVKSKDERIEVTHDSDYRNDIALLEVPNIHNCIQTVIINHSDIDSIVEALLIYKEKMKEFLGEGVLM